MTPPAFVPADPDTDFDLPHLTWAPEWVPAITAFCARAAAGKIPAPVKVPYGTRGLVSHHVPVDAVDGALADELWEFARAFFQFELPPPEGAALTGMIVGDYRDQLLSFLAWLRAALVELSGQTLAAHMIPTGDSGDNRDEGAEFRLHADVWHTEKLFNALNWTAGGGFPMLFPLDRAWGLLREVGFTEPALDEMRDELASSVWCTEFRSFNHWLWSSSPLGEEGYRALRAECTPVALSPGQGYLVVDRKWLHGRSEISWEGWERPSRDDRLYRLGYNSAADMRRSAEAEFDWSVAGTKEAGC